MAKQFKPETLCVQAGWTPKKGEPRVLPIYQSTTFKYDTSEQMARLFDLEDSGYFYTRLQNPTNDAVAAKIAALEGGVAAMLTSSGQAANFYAIFNICQAGDHFVCSSTIYGGTFNLFGVTLKKLGIDVTFVNPDASEEEISAAFRPNTKALFGETISNPTLEVLDIEKFARIAHSHGVPLIVDNTFPTPIYQSTTFKYDTSEQMARLFDLEDSGYFYTRLQNPTNDAVAAKIAALEGGVAAMLTSSGQAANFYAIFNICQAGDHFVCSSTIYGGTFNLFGVTLKKLGIDVTFVNPDASEEEISAAFRPNTKALFGETISNPTLEVLDIEKFARIAHSHGVPLIVDNTFPTPINCRPFEWGADIVVHSTTKYMDGHATSVGGAIVDSGNFDWDAHADKFPGLCTPDESYHGLTYTKAFGKMAYITKATAQLMRDLGSIQSPQNAFLLNLGLETLHLRMPQHCKNAQAVAEYLAQNDKVAWVNYCGLPGDKYYEQAQKYMPNGSCGVVTFGLKGGREESIKFMDSLKLAAIVTHVADARTCVLHPASHTHRQLTDEQLMEAGVRPDLIRFSVGIENAEDIIADIEQALNA